MPAAVITGASRGLGEALAEALARRGWDLVIAARGRDALERVEARLGSRVTAITGDVADPEHRRRLSRAVARLDRLDAIVNNASTLGPTPLDRLELLSLSELERVIRVNVVAPLGLIQAVLPHLRAASGVVVNVTSDAAVEAYETWGAYGASKAALDHVSAVLAAEHPDLHVYAFDPGDMRTKMQQDAFPGDDISDRPEPATVVPALLHLIDVRPPSGRVRAADLLPQEASA